VAAQSAASQEELSSISETKLLVSEVLQKSPCSKLTENIKEQTNYRSP
jgi:hypothetical protein